MGAIPATLLNCGCNVKTEEGFKIVEEQLLLPNWKVQRDCWKKCVLLLALHFVYLPTDSRSYVTLNVVTRRGHCAFRYELKAKSCFGTDRKSEAYRDHARVRSIQPFSADHKHSSPVPCHVWAVHISYGTPLPSARMPLRQIVRFEPDTTLIMPITQSSAHPHRDHHSAPSQDSSAGSYA